MTASAEPITVTGENQKLIGTITVGGQGLAGYSASQQYYIGSLTTNLGGPSFDTYCIDLNHSFSTPATWNVTNLSTFDSGPSDTDSANNSNSTIKVVGSYQKLAFLIDTYGPGATTADKAAALQIALWTVEYGSTVQVTVTSDLSTVNGLVTSYINAANSASTATLNSAAATFFVATDPSVPHQDLIGLPPGQINPLAVVPEPSSVAMMAVGLGLAVLRVRKSRRARPVA